MLPMENGTHGQDMRLSEIEVKADDQGEMRLQADALKIVPKFDSSAHLVMK
jgi:hypothetical protein